MRVLTLTACVLLAAACSSSINQATGAGAVTSGGASLTASGTATGAHQSGAATASATSGTTAGLSGSGTTASQTGAGSVTIGTGTGAAGQSSGTASGTGSSASGGTVGTTTGAAGGPDAGITVTFTTVDVHPAARAALQAAGIPVPDLGTGYSLSLTGVSVSQQGPVITPLYSQGITTSSGPYVFALTAADLQASSYGVLVSVTQGPPSNGPPSGGSNSQLSCPQLAQLRGVLADGGSPADVSSFFADAGGPDYFMVTASQLTGLFLTPTANVPGAVAYAVPASYAAILNCAGQPQKTLRDTDQGLALVYASGGRDQGQGAPLSGVTLSVNGAQNTPVVTYYGGDYSTSSSTTDAGTDTTGVATVVNVALGFAVPFLSASDAQGTALFDPEVATQPGSIFDVFVYPGG